MLETAIICFREGLEMFLIVAVTLAYLTKTGRKNLQRPVYAGIIVAIILSLTTGWHIADLAQDPRMEGALALTAAVLVSSMTYTMLRSARHIKQSITDQIEQSAKKSGWAAMSGLFVFTVLMIAREGMETAMMLGSMSGALSLTEILSGALLGFIAVIGIGYLWIKQSRKINIALFMQVTGVFLLLFCVHLFLYGAHELSEVDALPFVDNAAFHTVTEPFEPGEPIGNIITICLLAVPCIWLAYGYFSGQRVTARTIKESVIPAE